MALIDREGNLRQQENGVTLLNCGHAAPHTKAAAIILESPVKGEG